MTKPSVDQLREDYVARQMSMRELSAKYGLALSAVHRHVARAGIKARNAGRRSVITPERRRRILAMREGGHGIKQVPDAVGVSHNAVWKFLKAEGLPMFWLRRAS